MPKIVVQGYVADGEGNGKSAHEDANRPLLQQWFETNQDKLSLVAEQLTKKLGADKFKNVTLTNPQVSYEEITVNSNTWKNPKVTFTVEAKPGYQLTEPTTEESQISLSIRVLYSSQESNQNLLTIQGASPVAAPSTASATNTSPTVKNVNVYLNYTGPNIELDADLPRVGEQENTSLNGTSNVTDDFNNKFNKLLIRYKAETSLFQTIINYVNKFDPKFPAKFVTNSINGVTITKVQSDTQLRPGTLDDLVKNDRDNVFLQQIQGDTEAVYLPVTAIASNKWLNTFLIRIPLTKFVRPINVLEEQSAQDQTPEASQQS